MNIFNTLMSVGVMLVSMYVSFNHTVDLFEQYGFSGDLAFYTVLTVEGTFLQATINIIYCSIKGKKIPAPIRFITAVGVLLVGWSNVNAGLEYGIPGIILGLVPPTLMIASEILLTFMIVKKATSQTQTETQPTQATSKEQPEITSREFTTRLNDQKEQPVNEGNEHSTNGEQPIEPTNQPAKRSCEMCSVEIESEQDLCNDCEAKFEEDKEEQQLTTSSEDTANNQPEEDNHEAAATIASQEKVQPTSEEQPAEEEQQPVLVAMEKVQPAKKAKKKTARKTTTKKENNQEPNDLDVEEIIEKILEIEKKEGKRPGRDRLKKMTGCKPHRARAALEILKEQDKQKAS